MMMTVSTEGLRDVSVGEILFGKKREIRGNEERKTEKR